MLGKTTRDRRAERREATRLEILDAAWAVARQQGLGALTLRDVADRVGMRAPSLYTHVDSKLGLYDAMFGQAWQSCLAEMERVRAQLPGPGDPDRLPARAVLRRATRAFYDFSVADPVRHQLMDLRTIPGFEPSPEAYRPSLAVMEMTREQLGDLGVTRDEDVDLLVALVAGLIDTQLANDPGGQRWTRLFDRALDMYADAVGLPPEHREDDPS